MFFVGIPGIHHIRSVFNAGKQLAHFIGGRLSVIVQTDHDVALCLCKACHQGRMLSEIFGKIDTFYFIVCFANAPDDLKGIVRRAVIDQHNLIFVCWKRRHGFRNFVNDTAYGKRRFITGNNKTD